MQIKSDLQGLDFNNRSNQFKEANFNSFVDAKRFYKKSHLICNTIIPGKTQVKPSSQRGAAFDHF